jgi:hypothetical protein
MEKEKIECVTKDELILDYIDEYIKFLPYITNNLPNELDILLKPETNNYINKINEYMEK